jgi:hypothetical protein
MPGDVRARGKKIVALSDNTLERYSIDNQVLFNFPSLFGCIGIFLFQSSHLPLDSQRGIECEEDPEAHPNGLS